MKKKILKKIFLALLLIVVLAIGTVGCSQNDDPTDGNGEVTGPIGIISAMQSELEMLVEKSDIERVEKIGNTDYHIGKLEGQDIVLVQAGVGKSLSSAGTAILINEFDVSNVIFTGIAGAVTDDIEVLDIVVSTDLIIHDYGVVTDKGFEWTGKAGVDEETGVIPIDKNLENLAYKAAKKVAGEENTHKGRIVTGDQFVESETYVENLRTKFNASATEMEGASVARIAYEFNVPTIVIRTMSDKADGLARGSMDNFGQKAADISAEIVIEMLKSMEQNQSMEQSTNRQSFSFAG